ncbi:Uncharacterised protein [Campylobacter hyointestinalis subsp. hyointestinalis]|uniref:Uncharacterized protein n=1 Tax=Campylobacter hyointestinalis subsp. hyointestinalis TaxID=91352 RepID=A0A0S4SUI5_CAMHY|nr:hypothetical protein [Campylobacter hyointestinalis]CUU89656.1 Uncharacterised protein [Campylobacter hyointestinalis subsp. hyointestinalis]
MSNVTTIKRNYGVERTFGDIIYNPANKSVFATLDFGFMGQITINLVKQDNGGYDITKSYKDKDGALKSFTLGKLFPVKDKSGNIVEGLAKGSFGLYREYDKVAGKEYTQNNDCVILCSHKLQKTITFEKSGMVKVGYITGSFAIQIKEAVNQNLSVETIVENTNNVEDIEDVIPF